MASTAKLVCSYTTMSMTEPISHPESRFLKNGGVISKLHSIRRGWRIMSLPDHIFKMAASSQAQRRMGGQDSSSSAEH